MDHRIDRRQLLKAAAGWTLSGPLFDRTVPRRFHTYKAVAFDALTIFDPRPAFAATMRAFPDKGSEIVESWRTRQFEYTWLRATAHRYVDFWQVTGDALVYATRKAGVELSVEKREALMASYLELPVWPDVVPALERIKKAGLKLAVLSNFSPTMLRSCARSNGLEGAFDSLLSTDAVKSYKPDPKAYDLGPRRMGMKRADVLFAPFAAWDAAGAKAYGFPTFWVNRQNQPAEELGTSVDGVGSTLADLVRFVL